jgi:phosphoglycerol geranylgeranyltransferase
VSGRNPSFLIGEQVRGAPLVKRFGLETIPTAYMLIESGSETSVQFVTQTIPLPRNKPDLACAHALAAQYLGMRLVYLEAGSGADSGVPDELISVVADYVDIPVMTGGGICRPEHCAATIAAGASFVVVGTAVERDPSSKLVREMAAACHPHDKVAV